MRIRLSLLNQDLVHVTATFKKFGLKGNQARVLFKKLKRGSRVIATHLWLPLSAFQGIRFTQNCKIKFVGEVLPYRRANGSLDYRIGNIRHAEKVKEGDTSRRIDYIGNNGKRYLFTHQYGLLVQGKRDRYYKVHPRHKQSTTQARA